MKRYLLRLIPRTKTVLIYCKVLITGFFTLYLTSLPAARCVCLSDEHIIQDTFTDYPYRRFKAVAQLDCVAECLKAKSCKAFSFHYKQKICTLNQDSTSDNTVPSKGYVTGDITHWPKSLAGPCQFNSCEAGTKCVVYRNMVTKCIPDCGFPSTIDNAKLVEQRSDTEAIYTCTEGYVEKGSCTNSPVIVTCHNDGNWDIESVGCVKTTWDNLSSSSFEEDFPCKVGANISVTVQGVFTGSLEMVIFSSSSRVFEMIYDDKELEITFRPLQNSKFDASWFTIDDPFIIHMSVHDTHVQVEVNSILVFDSEIPQSTSIMEKMEIKRGITEVKVDYW